MRATTRLRRQLADPGMLVAPGAYDGIGARLIEQAGFSALYMTGAGTAAAHGLPDYGLLSMSEMVANAARITAASPLPLIADGDTGYGNELNVVRTVQEHERAGTAGLHIEDQVAPKRCGHLDGKELVPLEDFLAKIRAAVATRRDPDFLVIARTDARSVAGFDEAVHRANAALGAGADMAFVESPESLDEVRLVPQRVAGPCLLNMVWGGKTPVVGLDDAEAFLAPLPVARMLCTRRCRRPQLTASWQARMHCLRSCACSVAPSSTPAGTTALAPSNCCSRCRRRSSRRAGCSASWVARTVTCRSLPRHVRALRSTQVPWLAATDRPYC